MRLGSLRPLRSLEELRLYNNSLEEMPQIGRMPHLTILELNKNRIGAVPSGYFADLPSLEKLVLSQNMLEAVPSSLARCVHLQFLQLHENKLAAFEEAAWHELANLETLFLQGNPGLAVPVGLGQCAGLKRINVPTAPDDLAAVFETLAMAAPGGVYWDSHGAAHKK